MRARRSVSWIVSRYDHSHSIWLSSSCASRFLHLCFVCGAFPPRPRRPVIARLRVFAHSERDSLPLVGCAPTHWIFEGASALSAAEFCHSAHAVARRRWHCTGIERCVCICHTRSHLDFSMSTQRPNKRECSERADCVLVPIQTPLAARH